MNTHTDSEWQPLVAAVRVAGDLGSSLSRLLEGLGGLETVLSQSDRILLKPNINSYHDAPAAVDLEFLAAFIRHLQESGFGKLTVAEGSGNAWAPTADVVEKKGLLPVLDNLGVPFVNLDDVDYVAVETGGSFLPTIHLPALLGDYDRLVFLPNLKTHQSAGFTGTLKLAMGLTPQADRSLFHRESVPGAVADLFRVVKPDLSVVDGRTAFIAGGPTFGELAQPGVMLASADPVACDVEAVRILLQWGAAAQLGVHDPYETELLRCVKAPQRLTVRWV